MKVPKPKFKVGSPVSIHNKEYSGEPAEVLAVTSSGSRGSEWSAPRDKLDLSQAPQAFRYDVKLVGSEKVVNVPECHLRGACDLGTS
jgi:hypothetical protein